MLTRAPCEAPVADFVQYDEQSTVGGARADQGDGSGCSWVILGHVGSFWCGVASRENDFVAVAARDRTRLANLVFSFSSYGPLPHSSLKPFWLQVHKAISNKITIGLRRQHSPKVRV